MLETITCRTYIKVFHRMQYVRLLLFYSVIFQSVIFHSCKFQSTDLRGHLVFEAVERLGKADGSKKTEGTEETTPPLSPRNKFLITALVVLSPEMSRTVAAVRTGTWHPRFYQKALLTTPAPTGFRSAAWSTSYLKGSYIVLCLSINQFI